jgi:hypothetical protein
MIDKMIETKEEITIVDLIKELKKFIDKLNNHMIEIK